MQTPFLNSSKLPSTLRLAGALTAAVLGATLAGCVIMHTDNSNVNGKKVSAEQLAEVKPGAAKQVVVELLGVPSTKTDLGNGLEVWEWKYSQNSDKSSGFIFVFYSSQTSSYNQTTSVEFLNGVVTKTWASENKNKPDADK